MERNGIISAGNWIIDILKFIGRYPEKGNLAPISRIGEALGGCSHNVLLDIAALQSGIPLYAGGCIGDDKYGRMCLETAGSHGIDTSNMKVISGESTAMTDVFCETAGSASRTFFHYKGANSRLGVEEVLSMDVPARIFHLGYLLLLDALDAEDAEYGVRAARALDGLRRMGYKTSIDIVSEEGDRYAKVVLPCLKYTDYLIVNEIEAGKCLGIELRRKDGGVDMDEVLDAAENLLDHGVGSLVVIHFPEGGVAVSKTGEKAARESFRVPLEEVVSSVGAGDAFCAGALYAIHEGYSLDRMLDFANACARFNLFNASSTGGAPTLEEVREFLKQ